MRRILRIAGTTLVVAGALMLVWVVVVWRWQDPFTAAYTHWKQHQLASSYDHRFVAYKPSATPHTTISPALATKVLGQEARRYRLSSRRGQAIGRIRVPRLGLNMVFVNGTDAASLEKGPGRDLRTYMPGEGQLIYIAGHRTTYLAPFAHINSMRPGDLDHPRGPVRDLPLPGLPARDRPRRRPRRASLARPRGGRAAGLPPALLRVTPLHRLRPAHAGRAPRRALVHAALDEPLRRAARRRAGISVLSRV